jgi:ketosteroid isomerase-like protein
MNEATTNRPTDPASVLRQYVAAVEACARTRGGRPYENQCIGVFTIRDGKIRTVREYMDTLYAHDTAFASAAVPE